MQMHINCGKNATPLRAAERVTKDPLIDPAMGVADYDLEPATDQRMQSLMALLSRFVTFLTWWR